MPMTIELCLLLAVLCRVVMLMRLDEERPAAAVAFSSRPSFRRGRRAA